MSADKLHERTAKSIGHADDQPIFVAAEIEDDSVVANEIDGTAELPLYFGRVGPMRLGRNREPPWRRLAWRMCSTPLEVRLGVF